MHIKIKTRIFMPINYMRILSVILVLVGLILPSFSFAQNQVIKVPQNLEEAKIVGKKILEALPNILKETWRDGLRIIKKMWQKIKIFWNSYIGYRVKAFWQKILAIFGKEIEKRKEIIKEEFPKEKKELKEELPEVTKSLWERFKELIK